LTQPTDGAGIIHALYSLTYSEAKPGEKTRTNDDQHYGAIQLFQHGWS